MYRQPAAILVIGTLAQQIEQLRRKRKRQIIQEDIRRQKKERAKEKQKARRQGSK